MDTGLPFNPLRERLYEPGELYDAFLEDDPGSYSRCNDVEIYRRFKAFGTNPVVRDAESTLHALHDNSMSRLVNNYLSDKPRVVAIMGGHKMSRATDEYSRIVRLARGLSQKGILVASGGGPGAMEASHLGALLCNATESDVSSALMELSDQPNMPSNAAGLVRADGSIDPEVAVEMHRYLLPAIRIFRKQRQSLPGDSLAVPTWLYGHEPSTPFAGKIAKYFQNSIREDGLVTLGVTGIVFTEGKAGTLQEVFQDAAQNYYSTTGMFCKMVFLSSPAKRYWEDVLPVRPLIEALLGTLPTSAGKLLFTDDSEAAAQFMLNA